MDITNALHDAGIVVALTGSLDTNTAPEAQAHLDTVVATSPKRVIVDFGAVDYISSAGLRVLLATGKALRRSGGELRVCALNEIAQEVFDISGFSTLFKVHATAEEALGA